MKKQTALLFGVVVLALSLIGCPTGNDATSFPTLKLQDIAAATGMTSLEVNGADTVDLVLTVEGTFLGVNLGLTALRTGMTLTKTPQAGGAATTITITNVSFDGTQDPTITMTFGATDFAAGDTVKLEIIQGLMALADDPNVKNSMQILTTTVQ